MSLRVLVGCKRVIDYAVRKFQMALRGVRQGSQVEELPIKFENQPPSWYPPDESAVPKWSPTEWGPQTMEEKEIAHNALYGDKWGGDMILPEDFNATDTALPIGTRLTRFCIGMHSEAAFEELVKTFEKLGYCWINSGPRQVTITTQDRRGNLLTFKAKIIPMPERILVDFRRSRGDGIEFKRHFLKIKESLIDN